MYIQGITRRGHKYYVVFHGRRLDNKKVVRDMKLYIGRLDGDNIDEPKRQEIERKLSELDDPSLVQKFRSILHTLSYSFSSLVSDLKVEEVYNYGQELALHKVCEEIDLVGVINDHGYKGGGPPLGKVAEVLAINRNCDPCSCFQVPDWYARSSLPFFLGLPTSKLTYPVALRSLDYLQPKHTIPMQVALYENIRKVYGYECERLDIDITSSYFEGKMCILAKLGHSRDRRKDRPQIVIAFVVDQKGVLVTHKVWPGNRTDAKSLKPVDRVLRKEFNLEGTRIVDRGFATWENIKYMERNKDSYLVALRANVKSTGLLDEIDVPRKKWTDVGENEVAISVVKGKRKYVVLLNASVAKTNRASRLSKIEKAEKELEKLQKSIESGRARVKSRRERDERIGHIKRKYGVTKYFEIKGKRKGFGFTFERKGTWNDVQEYDGYQVFVTSELELSEREVVESYRVRDQIEKAICALKSVLELRPFNVRTKEHVLGLVFICALSYQLRSILRMKISDSGEDYSLEQAMSVLERLKAVDIEVKEDGTVKVHRKLSGLNDDSMRLIHVFNMNTGGALPHVEDPL